MDDRLDARQALAAAQRLDRLPVVGQVRGEERCLGRRLAWGDPVDVQHVMPLLEQAGDDCSTGLPASACDSDLHQPSLSADSRRVAIT